MSRIEKVQIRGIRSFHPTLAETLAFNTPLTLIVGYNGSGKTTIIEALKYATTGEQPPNSKIGGAFVHDPKLLGEREVTAQVRLMFRSIIGEEMIITRSLKVTQPKSNKSASLKTMEGTLSIRNGTEKHTISSKVAELDEEIPHKLGVSKSILQNVIFCHQDEALWPLSEPSALKKKFDEIFEAEKYTKAVVNLKAVYKKQDVRLREAKAYENANKTAKEKGERAAKFIRTLEADIEARTVECNELTRQMDDASQSFKSLTEQANSFLSIVQDLQNKQQQHRYKQDNAADLRNGIEEMNEPDRWLEDNLSQYAQRIQELKVEMQQKTDQFRQLQAELASSRAALSTKHAEQGRLQSDKDKYERQLEARVGMIRQAAELHEIRGYDGDLGDSHVRSFRERIEKLLSDKEREVERLQSENAKELEQASRIISELETRKATRTQDRVFAKQRMDANDKRASILQNDLLNLDVDEGSMAILESNFGDVQGRLQKATQDLNGSGLDAQIQEENDRVWQLEAESEKLTRELVECTRLASDRAQLDLVKKDLTKRRRDLDTLSNTWTERLTTVVGGPWEVETLEADFQRALRQQNASTTEAKKHVDAAQQELKQVEYKLSTLRDRQKKMLAESDRCQEKVLTVLKSVQTQDKVDIEAYEDEMDHLELDILGLEKDISLFDHLKEYYSRSQALLNKQNKCSLCERPFVDQPRERSRLMEKIVKNLDDGQKKGLEGEKDVQEAKLGQLRSVRPSYDGWRRAEAELPTIRKDIKAAETERDALVRRLEEQDEKFKQVDDKRQDVERMSGTVSTIVQTFKNVAEAESQIERLASQQQSSSMVRGAEEIHELQASCGDQLKAAKNRASKLSADKVRMKDLVGSLELEKSELKNKIAHAVRQGERKNDLVGQLGRLKDDNGNEREVMRQADKDLQALEPEIAKARSIREDTHQRGRGKEQELSRERDAVGNTVNKLKMIDNDIRDYIDRGSAASLAANQRAISTLDQSIANLEQESASLTGQVNKLRAEVDNSDRRKKNILDNLNYRKILRDLEALEHEIAELESRNATEDYNRLAGEARRWEAMRSKLSAERDTLFGALKSKDEELARLNAEYKQDYQHAAAQYQESMIKVRTTQAAMNDISLYQSALDKAVMQYHALKMEEVNRIAGELWHATYQGTDIDTILIRSDEAGSSRSYNYRLCMVKQDAEMDMRGRCSAGQKVLASIIIRLALAESFGVNCGLIALDEPTTNLDVENIRSLAVSLHGIIRARQAQANFQLIIITHDEEFLRHMQCSDFCDTFYRVKRNEKQSSSILKESISKLIDG